MLTNAGKAGQPRDKGMRLGAVLVGYVSVLCQTWVPQMQQGLSSATIVGV